MNGWDVNFLQEAVDICTNPSGKIEDCPVFRDYILSEDEQKECTMELPKVLANEKVAGSIGKALPGNVPIQYGPAPATVANPGPQTTTVPVPSVGYSEGAKPTDSIYLPGQVFKEHTSSPVALPSVAAGLDLGALAEPEPAPAPEPAQPTLKAASEAVSAPAVTPAPEASVEDGYKIVRTDYVTEGNVVNMVIVKERVEYVTLTTTTVTSTATIQGVKARHVPHMHRHRRRHGHY